VARLQPRRRAAVAQQFGIIGDVHGNFEALNRILTRHAEIPFWLCVGDLATSAGAYPEPAAPLYFIQGNNESFDRLAGFRSGAESVPNLHFIPNGTAITVSNVKVAGVGGTFAPTWYGTPAASLPVKGKDDKRRHFVREEVNAAKRLRNVDVLLTHEAPKPFWIDLPSSTTPTRKWRRDVGKEAITELADAIRPRLHCFGHHHTHAEFDREGIRTVCVDRVNRSYLLVDVGTFTWSVHPTVA
jgi:Icc-related predicted phosphoesterase